MNAITIEDQIAEVRRELRMRQHVYQQMVASGRMPEVEKKRKIEIMQAVLLTLEQVKTAGDPQAKLAL